MRRRAAAWIRVAALTAPRSLSAVSSKGSDFSTAPRAFFRKASAISLELVAHLPDMDR